MKHWTSAQIPPLHGRVAIVTGANSGLGFETTRALAAHGAQIIMATRNPDKARDARTRILAETPLASLQIIDLDLASLKSVRAFAAHFRAHFNRLDLLFNNAGVMALPRRETVDGFEMQFGTNYLGHFALTGLVLPSLLATQGSRVVNTTSIARWFGRINFDDLQGKRSYNRWRAYGQSKLANLLFSCELQRRLAAADAPTISIAAHPGYAHTGLQVSSATATGSAIEYFIHNFIGPRISQSAYMGALPQLYAATVAGLQGNELVGPRGPLSFWGYPHVETRNAREDNQQVADHLWRVSVELTGVDFAALQTLPRNASGLSSTSR